MKGSSYVQFHQVPDYLRDSASYFSTMDESVHLQLHEVPDYLRDSVFYNTLRENASDNKQEIFAIPADKFKPDPEKLQL